MSYKDWFTRYGSRSENAEIRTNYCYLTRPDKLGSCEDVIRDDKRTAALIAECQRLIEEATEHRQALAVRYGQLATMPYIDRLKLERCPYWSSGIRYIVTITRRYEDGTEIETLNECRSGKERREAIKRYEELKRQHPGIAAEMDIEKKSWER